MVGCAHALGNSPGQLVSCALKSLLFTDVALHNASFHPGRERLIGCPVVARLTPNEFRGDDGDRTGN